MSLAARDAAISPKEKIGPGPVILVCGPRGAGKDTVIRRAAEMLRHDRRVVFVQRIVTRPASAFEDNIAVTAAKFDEMTRGGAFAISWAAHGHRYGIPRSVDSDIASGRAAVANVSRLAVGEILSAYACVLTVLVTACDDVLRARLASRGREAGGDAALRLARSQEVGGALRVDATIVNEGAIDAAAIALVEVIRNGLQKSGQQ